MALKYKVGDRVRIKSLDWYNENKDEDGNIPLVENTNSKYNFTKRMRGLCGKVMTISSANSYYYDMVEDNGEYFWTDEMIECKVETKPKFKVGDKVILDPYPCVVTDVNWWDSLHGFVYTVRGLNFGKMVGEEDLIFDTFEEEVDLIPKFGEYSDNEPLDIPTMTTEFVKEHELPCPEGFIFKDENGNVINATKIVLEKKKKKYPKTYEECLKVLNIEGGRLCFNNSGITQYERDLYIMMNNLSKLLICRDAYWKIAGEEMRLGKPWKPDWLDDDTKKCVITSTGVFETFGGLGYINYILTFPTREMRDAFYENFKELIEQCKELL